MRKDIHFKADDGVTIRGWQYLPDGKGPFPTLVLAHGWASVKEMYMDKFAAAFAVAGFASIVFDHRNFGASDGEPRHEIDPQRQVRDYRDAVTFALTLGETAPGKIGVWGTSYSGAHAIMVGATDRRVRCVVAQVPFVNGFETSRRLVRSDHGVQLRALLEQDRRDRFDGKPPAYLPVVAASDAEPSSLPSPDSWAYFSTAKALAPDWKNEVTLKSVEMLSAYAPGAFIRHVSPTPLLLLVAENDVVTATDLALDAYAEAREPKRLVLLRGGHFGAYVEGFDIASSEAIQWFRQHLGGAN
jgi:pimeloyl-ACP methyl ester carboxylesterase